MADALLTSTLQQIDEILEQRAPSSVEERETKTAETYVKVRSPAFVEEFWQPPNDSQMVDELMRDAVPQAMRGASRTLTQESEVQSFYEGDCRVVGCKDKRRHND